MQLLNLKKTCGFHFTICVYFPNFQHLWDLSQSQWLAALSLKTGPFSRRHWQFDFRYSHVFPVALKGSMSSMNNFVNNLWRRTRLQCVQCFPLISLRMKSDPKGLSLSRAKTVFIDLLLPQNCQNDWKLRKLRLNAFYLSRWVVLTGCLGAPGSSGNRFPSDWLHCIERGAVS